MLEESVSGLGDSRWHSRAHSPVLPVQVCRIKNRNVCGCCDWFLSEVLCKVFLMKVKPILSPRLKRDLGNLHMKTTIL